MLRYGGGSCECSRRLQAGLLGHVSSPCMHSCLWQPSFMLLWQSKHTVPLRHIWQPWFAPLWVASLLVPSLQRDQHHVCAPITVGSLHCMLVAAQLNAMSCKQHLHPSAAKSVCNTVNLLSFIVM